MNGHFLRAFLVQTTPFHFSLSLILSSRDTFRSCLSLSVRGECEKNGWQKSERHKERERRVNRRNLPENKRTPWAYRCRKIQFNHHYYSKNFLACEYLFLFAGEMEVILAIIILLCAHRSRRVSPRLGSSFHTTYSPADFHLACHADIHITFWSCLFAWCAMPQQYCHLNFFYSHSETAQKIEFPVISSYSMHIFERFFFFHTHNLYRTDRWMRLCFMGFLSLICCKNLIELQLPKFNQKLLSFRWQTIFHISTRHFQLLLLNTSGSVYASFLTMWTNIFGCGKLNFTKIKIGIIMIYFSRGGTIFFLFGNEMKSTQWIHSLNLMCVYHKSG